MSVCRVRSRPSSVAELRRGRGLGRAPSAPPPKKFFAMILVISGSLVTIKYLNWSVIVSSRGFPDVFESVLAVVIILRLLGLFAIYPDRKQKLVLDVNTVHEHLMHGRWHALLWI